MSNSPNSQRSDTGVARKAPKTTSWEDRWFELRMLSDIESILAGVDPVRLVPSIGRLLSEELPSADIVIAKKRGADEVVLFGEPTEPASDELLVHELRHSADGFVVKALVPRNGFRHRASSYLRFAPFLLALAENRGPRDSGIRGRRTRDSTGHPISRNPAVLRLLDEAALIGQADLSVLICGESGTGKELLARFIHDSSKRSGGPFVAVNCAGLPRDLVEAELFGVEKGAATGVNARPGKFELANGGSVLLDEIGDMPLQTQAMILRVLEEGVVHRVGSTRPRPVSLRIIAATNHDLDGLLESGRFREDLYFRIASWMGHLPPLRERREDIPHLAAHFISLEHANCGKRCTGFSARAMDALCSFDWPGNIRQLKNEIGRAYAVAPNGQKIDIAHLNSALLSEPSILDGASLRNRLESVERQIIQREIVACNGDMKRVADRLAIPLSTFYRRLKQLGIRRRPRRRE